jgi:hypothetical protein
MTVLISLASNEHVAIQQRRLAEILAALPESTTFILDGRLRKGESSEQLAASLGRSAPDIEREIAIVLLALQQVIPEALAEIPREINPTFCPQSGESAALLAAARYFQDTGRKHHAVTNWTLAAFTGGDTKPSFDAVSSHFQAGKAFARQARVAGITNDDRKALSASALDNLQRAAAIAELVRNDSERGQILAEMVEVLLTQDDINMARVYSDIADRLADANGDRQLSLRLQRAIIAWHLEQSRQLLCHGRLALAEEHALRAERACTGDLQLEACSAQALIEEINSLAGEADHHARVGEWARMILKTDVVDDALPANNDAGKVSANDLAASDQNTPPHLFHPL